MKALKTSLERLVHGCKYFPIIIPLNCQTFDYFTKYRVVCFICLVCRGTNTGLGHSVGHYSEFRTRYTNCTYVDGNLEIVFITDPNFDLSFLRDIREVTGYVLIVSNYVSYIPLTSLRIIRGRSLFEHEGRYYSLYVALNYDSATPGVGLKELHLVSLHGTCRNVSELRYLKLELGATDTF